MTPYLRPPADVCSTDACRKARDLWLLPTVQLALETAIRQGEPLHLRWGRIDLDAHLPENQER